MSAADGALVARLDRAGTSVLRALPHARVSAGLLRRYRMLLRRGTQVRCPLCEHGFTHFADDWNRPGAICWRCGSQERHRVLWLHLQANPHLLTSARSLLHFAPEWCLERRLAATPGLSYVTADLDPRRALLALDLTALDLPDGAFDAILCSHVLEHIPDDAAAMRELHRVLAPGGWAIVMVPLDSARASTLEDPAIASPRQRERAYWQHDHVRLYGRDLEHRLAAAGLQVRRERPIAELGPERAAHYGLGAVDDVYLCTKAGS